MGIFVLVLSSVIIMTMASWSTRRKYSYITGIVLFLVFLLASASVYIFYRPPSCSDGKQNQGEFGVDCGGPCPKICKVQSLELISLWQRTFLVTPGYYSAVAYIENPNLDGGVDQIQYSFKIYDGNNILIAERVGRTFIPPRKLFPIFESLISTGNRFPARVTFSFIEEPEWKTYNVSEPELRISNQSLRETGTRPILTAEITNQSFMQVSNFDVVVILYDEDGNAGAASKTLVNSVSPGQTEVLSFSWSLPFNFVPTRIEMIPEIYPGVNY